MTKAKYLIFFVVAAVFFGFTGSAMAYFSDHLQTGEYGDVDEKNATEAKYQGYEVTEDVLLTFSVGSDLFNKDGRPGRGTPVFSKGLHGRRDEGEPVGNPVLSALGADSLLLERVRKNRVMDESNAIFAWRFRLDAGVDSMDVDSMVLFSPSEYVDLYLHYYTYEEEVAGVDVATLRLYADGHTDIFVASPVPVPAPVLLLGSGLMAMAYIRRKRMA